MRNLKVSEATEAVTLYRLLTGQNGAFNEETRPKVKKKRKECKCVRLESAVIFGSVRHLLASGNNEIKLCGEGDMQISAGSCFGSSALKPLMFATVAIKKKEPDLFCVAVSRGRPARPTGGGKKKSTRLMCGHTNVSGL